MRDAWRRPWDWAVALRDWYRWSRSAGNSVWWSAYFAVKAAHLGTTASIRAQGVRWANARRLGLRSW